MSSDSSVIEGSIATPALFGELFHRHAKAIHRYVARRAGDAVADDVTSETFLIAFERRANFDPAYSDARPWLHGIATNLLHRHRVAEARVFKTLERMPLDPESHDPRAAVDEGIDAARTITVMARAIRRLSTGDRDCLLLYAWADLSYEQIAAALNIPVGTVRSRLNRARRALRSGTALTEERENERAHIATDPA